LQAKVKCLATFYGVPLRVAARDVSEKERAEEASVSLQRQAVLGRLATAISDLEAMARARNPRYVAPPGGGELEAYSRRIEAALKVVGSVEREPPSEARSEALRRLTAHLATLMGPDVVRLRLASNPAAAAWFAAPDDRSPAQVQADLRAAAGVLERANENRSSADARAEARATVEKHFGLIELAKLLGGQAQYLSASGRETSAASLDSELSLLWVTWYPRAGFLPNPLFHRPATARAAPLPALMVSRIDGPTPQIVRDLILASLRTERDGLSGKVVIDAGGAKQLSPDRKNPGYWAYEQTLMDLAKVVKTHVTLPLVMDIAAVPIPPGTAAGVAVYVGWYSVGKYVPGCAFVPGAVGFHIASFEMASMRRADYHGWVPGLLSDGIAATLGPVA
ncbi:MAG TPA: TIGR03790 family protein, partial [Tepidisphaeraceae bacterium]|nr:TIGR03790 family protein [Tepidisphaeraceae bacterium]